MTLNFYTLGVIYLVYSFLGWVAETVVATIRGGRFANRGAAAGPFCFIYGTTGVLLAVSFGDLRTEPVYLFFACMMAATVMEWITAKLLERLHRRKWWDYSGKKFNLNGYVCLQYSLLWGALGTASVLWGNNVLLQLCAHIPVWLLRPAVWVSLTVAVLDQIGSAVLVQQYAARHPMLEQLNQRLGERSDTLRRRIALYIEKRIQYAYPAAARQEQTALRKGEKNFLSVSDLLWLFVIGAFLGDMVETVFCRVTAGVWMSRSSLVWGPFSVVWGLALVLGILLLIHPVAFSQAVCYVLGICAFVYGAWKIWGYWKDRKLGGVFQLELIVGVILVVIGLVALFKSEVLLSILPVIIGLIILMDGLVTINQALNLRKLDYRWKYLLPMGIVVAVFGLVLVLNPFGSAMLLMRFLGFTLLVDGFCDFWWYYRLKKLFE